MFPWACMRSAFESVQFNSVKKKLNIWVWGQCLLLESANQLTTGLSTKYCTQVNVLAIEKVSEAEAWWSKFPSLPNWESRAPSLSGFKTYLLENAGIDGKTFLASSGLMFNWSLRIWGQLNLCIGDWSWPNKVSVSGLPLNSDGIDKLWFISLHSSSIWISITILCPTEYCWPLHRNGELL